ncbi:MAG: 2-amino-4-hydroxy-6-hydroxymethyldihydropteridine diphosphokinase [Rikenellaceae bacterium]
MAIDVVILLGGNLGDVRANLAQCRVELGERVGKIISISKELESEAWGFSSEEKFVNQAVLISTKLSPEDLLRATQSIELDLGRDRADELKQKKISGEVYASRVIDVDIITYGSQTIEQEGLIIPHPRMHEREFVLRPMAEVAPYWRHPLLNKMTEELLNELIL